MYVAHSKITTTERVKPVKAKPVRSAFSEQYSYEFYKKACEKYADRIAEIQKHYPGRVPPFIK